MGFFDKLKNGLNKTKTSFDDKINNVFKNFRKVDEDFLDELEEVLIMSDVGTETSLKIITTLRDKIKKENIQKAKTDIQIFQKNIDDLYNSLDSNKKAKDVAQKLLINYIEAKMQFATKHLKNVSIKYYTIF